MKVKIGNYPNRWISRIHTDHMERKYGFLWEMNHERDDKKPVVPTRFDNLIEKLEDVLQVVYNCTGNLIIDLTVQKVKVHIDPWDTWSMDHTLSPIIHPMLVQLKATNHGAPYVDNKHVPKALRSSKQQLSDYRNKGDVDDLHFDRWNWVMDEMIWAFEQKTLDDWEAQYYEYEDVPVDDTSTDFGERLGLKLLWRDEEGRQGHQKRMSNGFKLFGIFYENLWD